MKLSAGKVRAFQKKIWGYYEKQGRELSWRRTRDPYRIFVSEVMLQQTQVARAVKKYPEFVKKFPSFRALASASTAEVLKVWQGMGYNRRALYLSRAARIVCEKYAGKLPKDIEKLDALPGIGRATAASVFVFVWDKPAVFLETNIRTVFIHFFFPRRKKVRDVELLPLVLMTLPSKVQPYRFSTPIGFSVIDCTTEKAQSGFASHTKASHAFSPAPNGAKRSVVRAAGGEPFYRSKVEPCSVREWYYALMDYGAMLKKTKENFSRKSAGFVRQSEFVGSHRELRGEIVRRAANGGVVRERDLISFHNTGLPVKKILSDLVAEGFLKKRRDSFVIR